MRSLWDCILWLNEGSVMMMNSRLGANYRRLFSASLGTNLGDGLMWTAFIWLASALTRDPVVIAIVGFAGNVPWLLFSLPAGVIADRMNRRHLIVAMDAFRAVIIALLAGAVWFWRDALSSPAELAEAGISTPTAAIPLLVAMVVGQFVLGSAEVVRDNAAQTIMPAVVKPDQLEKANGRLWAGETTMNNFVGPPLGGFLVGIAAAVPLILNAGFYAASAVLIAGMMGNFRPRSVEPVPGQGQEPDHAHDDTHGHAPKGTYSHAHGDTHGDAHGQDSAQPKPSWRTEMVEGFRWLWQHQFLRNLAIILGLLNFFAANASVITVLFVQDVLGLYEGWKFGLVTTGFAAGAILGSLVSDRVAKKFRVKTVLLGAMVITVVCSTLMGLSVNAAMFWLVAVVSAVGMMLWNVVTVSLRQRLIPDELLGRVNSVYRFFGWGTMSLGLLAGGAIVGAFEGVLGREWALRLPFFVQAAAAVLILLYSWRKLHPPIPAGPEASPQVPQV